MLFHILHWDLSPLSDAERLKVEQQLASLSEIPDMRWFASGRDTENPGQTGAMILFDDPAALARYRAHPIHVEFAQVLRALPNRTQHLDLTVDSLPKGA